MGRFLFLDQPKKNAACAGGWPGIGSTTADSRMTESHLSGPTGRADSYGFVYNFDAAGNRTAVIQMNQPTINYSDNGRGVNQYNGSAYDANGNTTDSAVGWTYTYDAEHKLVSANGSDGHLLQCFYDGLGRLVSQITNTAGAPVGTAFLYAGAQRIEERDAYNANAATNLRYLYFFDAPGSDALLFRQGGPWGRLWYQTDALGNTTHLSAESYNAQGQLTGGTVVEQYLYDAFGTPSAYDAAGNLLPGGTQYDNRCLFKSSGGYEWLAQPGLYQCRARLYLPQHGRFLQPDPLGQAGGSEPLRLLRQRSRQRQRSERVGE